MPARISPAFSARVLLSALLLIVASFAEEQPRRILLAPSSTISSGTLLKDLDKCSGIALTIKQDKADYILEAAHTPKESRSYQFTLFSKTGDAIYHTGAMNQGNAVKDVCEFIDRQTTAVAVNPFRKPGGHA
jgi:hypothetical protein